VLVWGASGGLGSFAIQLCATAGANAIAVISEEDKRDFVMGLGAKGVINRKELQLLGPAAEGQFARIQGPGSAKSAEVRQGDLGHHRQGQQRRHGLRAPWRGDLPGLTFVCKRGGMVVICAGTTGFN
jgi:crotonyl-CoA carboxylase/reductase